MQTRKQFLKNALGIAAGYSLLHGFENEVLAQNQIAILRQVSHPKRILLDCLVDHRLITCHLPVNK
jgi:hypothetical protein